MEPGGEGQNLCKFAILEVRYLDWLSPADNVLDLMYVLSRIQ